MRKCGPGGRAPGNSRKRDLVSHVGVNVHSKLTDPGRARRSRQRGGGGH